MQYIAILLMILGSTLTHASAPIEGAYSECVKDASKIYPKISSFTKFKNIDESEVIDFLQVNVPAAFLQANLYHSEEEPQYSRGSQTAIFFSIQPLPYINVIPRKLYPRFIALCEAKQNPYSLACKETTDVAEGYRFAIQDFVLDINFKTDNSCKETKLLQTNHFRIEINDTEYAQIKQQLKDLGVPPETVEQMTNVKSFLGDYWKAFFEAWKKDDWLK